MERTVLEERDALSMERLASITKEHTAQEPFGDYFRKTASFVIKMDEVYRKIKDGKTESYTLEQWQAFNQSLYEDILPENYEHSYGNPKYAVEKLGEVHGRILSFLYAELYALIGYAFEQRLHEKVILQSSRDTEGSSRSSTGLRVITVRSRWHTAFGKLLIQSLILQRRS